MSCTTASLKCPICLHSGIFDNADSLRNRLVMVSTDKLSCPVCQEAVIGLDKLTIHLFSHVNLSTNENPANYTSKNQNKSNEHEAKSSSRPKKTKTSASKNKPSTTTACAPVFVKIYPKLPTVPQVTKLEKPNRNAEGHDNDCYKTNKSIKMESTPSQANTTCNICGLQFVDSNILKMHRCLIHNIEDDSSQALTRYDCHLCPKNFKMRGSLMVHLRVAHLGFSSESNDSNPVKNIDGVENASKESENFIKNENKQWQCDVCRKCFTTKYFLKKHRRLHTGETPYACNQCNKTFTFQQSYHKHLLYHNDEKPHTCNYCGRAFKELSTLHNHQRIHTGEKPFSCETCGKCFRQRVSYLVHRRIHTGVMPYKCTACEKSFRYKVSQRTHKCQAQPPGTVIRQTGHLVEKLKKKHGDVVPPLETIIKPSDTSPSFTIDVTNINASTPQCIASLSLEDTESDNFNLIDEAFNKPSNKNAMSSDLDDNRSTDIAASSGNLKELLNINLEELIHDIPADDEKNVPSPSDILKNLCLGQDDEFINLKQTEQFVKEIFQDFI